MLTKWEPFEPFFNIEKIFEPFPFLPVVPKMKFGWDFPVDLYEFKGNLIAEMYIPEINPEKIEITFLNGDLKIAATREETKETKEKNFFCQEIKRGTFERVIKLPYEVKTEMVEAQFKNGVLKIVLPKKVETIEKVKVQIH